MRVAIVINTSWNIYNFRSGLIKAFLAKGWEVVAIAPKDDFSDRLIQMGCEFVPIEMDNKGSNPIRDLGLFFRFIATYRKAKIDLALQYTIKPNIYGTLAARVLGIPVINNVSGLGTVFLHDNWVSKIAQQLYRFAFRFPKRVFFQNSDDRDLFIQMKLVDEKRTGLLPGSGVDLSRYTPTPVLESKPFRFLFIGRLLYDKGIREYAEAAKILKTKGLEIEMAILGFVETQSGLGIAENTVREWESKGWVKFLGGTDDVRPYIMDAQCVVLPSYREGTPKALLEALALGRPIVTTDAPGCRETVVEGYNGMMCHVKDGEDLALAMESMLHFTPEKLNQLGQNGRKMAEEKFDEKIVIGRYLGEIESLKQNSKH
ncbi:MAG: glycosyltransferase family 4 protein [Cytophagales bacterium]|nr:glycosyltransferase family 4 protein [Cytophagales bacterium]